MNFIDAKVEGKEYMLFYVNLKEIEITVEAFCLKILKIVESNSMLSQRRKYVKNRTITEALINISRY